MNKTRILLLCLFTFLVAYPAQATDLPTAYDAYINDYARMLSMEEESQLTQRLEFHHQHTGHHIGIVTLQNSASYSEGAETLGEFADRLYQHWQNESSKASPSALIVLDKSTAQIAIKMSHNFPAHYPSIANDISKVQIEELQKTQNTGLVLQQGIDQLIAITLSEVSYFEWHKWKFLAGFYVLFSLMIALLIRNNQKAPLILWCIGFCGVFILTVIRSLLPNSNLARN